MKIEIVLKNGRTIITDKYKSISSMEEVFKVMGYIVVNEETIGAEMVERYKEIKEDSVVFYPPIKEQVKQPAHYADRVAKGLPETIDAIASSLENDNLTALMGYLLGNTYKYGARLGLKDDFVQDVKKMAVYFLWFLDEVDKENETTILEDVLKDRKVIGGGYERN